MHRQWNHAFMALSHPYSIKKIKGDDINLIVFCMRGHENMYLIVIYWCIKNWNHCSWYQCQVKQIYYQFKWVSLMFFLRHKVPYNLWYWFNQIYLTLQMILQYIYHFVIYSFFHCFIINILYLPGLILHCRNNNTTCVHFHWVALIPCSLLVYINNYCTVMS